MLSFFQTDPTSNLREQAKAVLHHAGKIWSYRRDLLDESETASFLEAQSNVVTLSTAKSPDLAALETAITKLDKIMREIGGSIYPNKMIPEWVELIIVAAIIAGGVRAFFLQPFKIPTNSMYPTYHGMTAEVYPLDQDPPKGLARIWGKITEWKNTIVVTAPAAGEVLVPLNANKGLMMLPNEPDDGIFGTGLLPGTANVYALYVGMEKRVSIVVPQEFNFMSVLLKTYYPDVAKNPRPEGDLWREILKAAQDRGDVLTSNGRSFLKTGHIVKPGDKLVNFSVLTGDMVFVDRFSYNFVRPSIGDPFVFATKNIPGLTADNNGTPQDLYFIKRLVGQPGDTLQVRAPVLFRNGEPISGKLAFEKNNTQQVAQNYFGYVTAPDHICPLVEPFTVPEHYYFAMGDNSSNSKDSRYWGGVPEKEVIGRGLFILYPFTNRWGVAE